MILVIKGGEIMKNPAKGGKVWTADDVAMLRRLAKGNTPTRVMALKLGRTAVAIYDKAGDLGLSLRPTNQSPYNRRKT